jgi:hypothetical protein
VDHPYLSGFATDERHGYTVGDGHNQREALCVRYQGVGLPGEPWSAHPHDPVPGDLTHPSRLAPVHSVAYAVPVFSDGIRVVADLQGDVEGIER